MTYTMHEKDAGQIYYFQCSYNVATAIYLVALSVSTNPWFAVIILFASLWNTTAVHHANFISRLRIFK